jgi:hypothetical protein
MDPDFDLLTGLLAAGLNPVVLDQFGGIRYELAPDGTVVATPIPWTDFFTDPNPIPPTPETEE